MLRRKVVWGWSDARYSAKLAGFPDRVWAWKALTKSHDARFAQVFRESTTTIIKLSLRIADGLPDAVRNAKS